MLIESHPGNNIGNLSMAWSERSRSSVSLVLKKQEKATTNTNSLSAAFDTTNMDFLDWWRFDMRKARRPQISVQQSGYIFD
jgi:hypothetical protein